MTTKLTDWVAAKRLQTDEDRRAYLDLVLAGGDPGHIPITLANIARSRETASSHVTPSGDNVFLDLGFPTEEAAALKTASDRIIQEKLAAQSRQLAAKHLAENEATDGMAGDGLEDAPVHGYDAAIARVTPI